MKKERKNIKIFYIFLEFILKMSTGSNTSAGGSKQGSEQTNIGNLFDFMHSFIEI